MLEKFRQIRDAATPHPWRGVRPWRRHSLVLMVAGLVFCGIGMSYILSEPAPSRNIALQVALSWWGIRVWGGIFIFAGVLSIISSRWPPVSKTWGYMVLTGLSAGWSMFYLTAILFLDSPWTNVSGSLSWGLVAFMWWAISGLRNPGEADEGFVMYAIERQLEA